MELFLVRHGDSPFAAETDHLRSLSPLGESQALSSARYIAKQCINASTLIVCSDANRTLTTAQIIQQQLGQVQLIADYKFYNALVGDWCDAMKQYSDNTQLILVGHNPTMSILSQHLIPTQSFHYKPACVGHFSLEIETDGLKLPAHLNEFYSPDAIQ